MPRNKDKTANQRPATTTTTSVERRDGADRRDAPDRRAGEDRRRKAAPVAVERRAGGDRREKGPGAERRKVQRRINEYVLGPDVLEFINAVNEFKSVEQKPFPTWSDIHRIFLALGYRKVAE